MTYAHLFAPPHHAYGNDTSFLDSHAPIGLWEDGPVGQFESGDVYGVDYFGLFNVGNKSSGQRNKAFEVLKKISAGIGHPRSFSASAFRGYTRTKAAAARNEVAKALKAWAKDNGISLTNPLDPLATLSTAETNLAKLGDSEEAPPPPPDEPTPSTVTEPYPWEAGGTPGVDPSPDLFAPPGPESGYPAQTGWNPNQPAYQQPPPPPEDPPASMWKNPWVLGGLVAAFGVLGLGAFLIFRDKTPAALPLPQAPLGAQNYWR